MQDGDQLSDEVLLEIGRLMWAAIKLESVVYPVCRSIKPRRGGSVEIPIGQQIHLARQDLKAFPRDDLRVRADAWLIRARDALKERTTVMHAAPETFAPLASHLSSGVLDRVLARIPRGKADPPTGCPFTLEELRRVRLRVERARNGWRELATTLGERRCELESAGA